MTFQKIASELAKREGRKSQVRIGDIRELLKELVNWAAEIRDGAAHGPCPLCALEEMASKRRKPKKASRA